ncbi:MAG: ADP-ribosylglycohydrolase, partial [Lachnospiraceae bacterium]|nr:ADP-ribosylglycohydrolase [Lachnospiraceae bacterium]
MIGAIIGDVVGSRFEFHNYLDKDFDFFAPRCRFTDDTVMTCAVAQALMDSREDHSDLYEKTVSAMQRIG